MDEVVINIAKALGVQRAAELAVNEPSPGVLGPLSTETPEEAESRRSEADTAESEADKAKREREAFQSAVWKIVGPEVEGFSEIFLAS